MRAHWQRIQLVWGKTLMANRYCQRLVLDSRREAAGCHISFLPLPCFEQIHSCFEQIHCTNQKEYRSGDVVQTLLRYPTVTCPGCKWPMMPSPPLPVSVDTDLCDVVYTCKNCGAITTRIIKIEK